MWNVYNVNFRDVGFFLRFGMFDMWDDWGLGRLGVCNFRDVGCLGCSECRMFVVWDVRDAEYS